MTPLELAILMGAKDDRLLEIIEDIDNLNPPASEREMETREIAMRRLDVITDPEARGNPWLIS